ncbi:hypothetical protein V8F20_012443 [Naviculisporaceae sp. PSN 640]
MAGLSFSYPISREYPYKWFPWVVVIGGFLFTVLFSVFSLATKGYYLEVMFTRNPNVTEAELYWFSRAPFSWTDPVESFSTLSATCQATELQVGTRVFTDKLWRSFEIKQVYIGGKNDPAHEILEPVLVYKHNQLENCTIETMSIHVRNETSLSKQYNMESLIFFDRIEGWADVSCDVKTDPPARILLSAKLSDQVGSWMSETGVIEPSEVTDPMKKRSAVVLGEFMLSMLDQLVKRRQQLSTRDTVDQNPDLLPAIYELSHNTSVPSITSPDFFFGFRMTPSVRGPSTGTGSTSSYDDFDYAPLGLIFPDQPPDAPPPDPIPSTVDRLAKVFYSLLLADLGQSDDTVLTSRETVVSWVEKLQAETDEVMKDEGPQNYDIVNFWKDATVDMALPQKEDENKHMDEDGTSFAGPTTTPGRIGTDWRKSTIYTQYTCQVPKQRVTGSVIIAVFVSDLVLLQALWAVFTWGTMLWMQRSNGTRKETVMHCQGCVSDDLEGGVRHDGDLERCDGGHEGKLRRWISPRKGVGRSLTGLTVTDTDTEGTSSVGNNSFRHVGRAD